MTSGLIVHLSDCIHRRNGAFILILAMILPFSQKPKPHALLKLENPGRYRKTGIRCGDCYRAKEAGGEDIDRFGHHGVGVSSNYGFII